MRVRWGPLLLAAVATGVLVLLVRGCILARGQSGLGAALPASDPVIRVYDHRAAQVMELPLETYLVGVTAAEMPASFAPEALKAQAVAARTYTLYHMQHGGCRQHGTDVCTNSGCCQAYSSPSRMKENWGASYRRNRQRMVQAVADTAGEVLLYAGEPIDALYHSASGGSTENAEDVYASAVPYLRGVPSTAETGTARLAGEKSWTKKEFCQLVNDKWPEARLTPARLEQQLAVTQATPGGRAKAVQVGKTSVTGRQLRSLLGLDSTLLTIAFSTGSVTFTTRGYGHGVGMSQTGANAMALGGRTYREILCYYYTDVTLGRLSLT